MSIDVSLILSPIMAGNGDLVKGDQSDPGVDPWDTALETSLGHEPLCLSLLPIPAFPELYDLQA